MTTRLLETNYLGTASVVVQRDWYFIDEQPAPALHLAYPEVCAVLRIVLVALPHLSRSCEHFPNGFDLHLILPAPLVLFLSSKKCFSHRCRANMTHGRLSWPDSGLDFQVNALRIFGVVSSSQFETRRPKPGV